jgi:hypothetical protein
MDMLKTKQPSLFVYLAIGALAMGLGWGIRGQFGHERGAMIPGVLTAVALIIVSPDSAKRNRVAAIGVAGGLGMAVGGVMSYDEITKLVEQPETILRGVLLLGAKGAIWGGIGGGVIGMALSSVRYHWWNVLWLVPVFAFWLATGNVPTGGSLSQGDMSKTLAVSFVAFLAWLHFYKQDRTALLFAVLTAIFFGVGFPFATWICKMGEKTSIAVDWWKVAEITWGAFGGLAWGLGAYLIDQEGEGPRRIRWSAATWAGLFFCAGVVPLWNAHNALAKWIVEKNAFPASAQLWFFGACVCFVYVFICLAVSKPVPLSELGIAVLLYVWVGTSVYALELLKEAVPFPWDNGQKWTHFAFLVLLTITAGYAILRWRLAERRIAREQSAARIAQHPAELV